MIPYPRHTGVDEVDEIWRTENDYVVGSSTEFFVESVEWLQNDHHVRHVITSEPDMRRSRLISCLGQVVIDTMVGMDKDSSSEFLASEKFDSDLELDAGMHKNDAHPCPRVFRGHGYGHPM
jgi:hypothetical protein